MSDSKRTGRHLSKQQYHHVFWVRKVTSFYNLSWNTHFNGNDSCDSKTLKCLSKWRTALPSLKFPHQVDVCVSHFNNDGKIWRYHIHLERANPTSVRSTKWLKVWQADKRPSHDFYSCKVYHSQQGVQTW